MRKVMNRSLVASLSALALTACSTSNKAQVESNKTQAKITSDVATRVTPTEEMDEEYLYIGQTERELVEQNNTFAFNLFQQTAGRGNNVVSPLSVTYLMSMLADGADGQTLREMLAALGWKDAKQADIDALCKMLIDKSGKLDKQTTINIANYIALNKQTTLLADYAEQVKTNYKAGVETLDFSRQESTQHVNNWCKEQTDGMIPSIVDQLDPGAALIAMNAIYFNGTWENKFQKSSTREENFKGYTRDIKKVQMMRQSEKFNYIDNDTLQAVTLPYGNGAYAMTVLLPREGKSIDEMMAGLSAEKFTSLLYDMDQCIVNLKLPRFTIETKTDLNGVISALGAPSMFTTEANFSKMSQQPLYVSKMLQKAKIEVSEEGTKAAAVTAAIMMMASLHPQEPRRVTFHANRPFVYVISQRATGAVLFMGQYVGD